MISFKVMEDWKLETTTDLNKLFTLYIQSVTYPEEFSEGYSKRVYDKISEVLKKWLISIRLNLYI